MDETLHIQMTKPVVERIKTGINGFDALIEGGFPKGANIVISGEPGSGKTIMAMAYIAQGCKNNEKCLYITVEQQPSDIIEQALQFNWDFAKWQGQGLLQITHIDFKKPIDNKVYEQILWTIENDRYTRVVIDSINPIFHAPLPIYYIDSSMKIPDRTATAELTRTNIITLFDKTKEKQVTTLCIAQEDDTDPSNTLIEYIGDGFIFLNSVEVADTLTRTVKIKKMRKTRIDGLTHAFDFTDTGVVVKGKEV